MNKNDVEVKLKLSDKLYNEIVRKKTIKLRLIGETDDGKSSFKQTNLMISENNRSDVYINGTSRIYGYDRINKENNQNIDESVKNTKLQ
ncbi:hypothetical protein ENUP19_0099G0005 [Entamoeba nuttalli]|uniref:Uncharacterized protein n=1 Tax=Entamoeba nuttalli TaxID=412467 RepID=A0ABQ0DH96_9EUKA